MNLTSRKCCMNTVMNVYSRSIENTILHIRFSSASTTELAYSMLGLLAPRAQGKWLTARFVAFIRIVLSISRKQPWRSCFCDLATSIFGFGI